LDYWDKRLLVFDQCWNNNAGIISPDHTLFVFFLADLMIIASQSLFYLMSNIFMVCLWSQQLQSVKLFL